MTKTRFASILLLALGLTGCSTGLDDARYPTGSSTLAASEAFDAVYSVDPDGGTVARIDVATGDVANATVGAEPTRIARVGDRIVATLRAERGLAVLQDRDGELVMTGRIDTAAEPFGVVASESGDRLYVAASTANLVQEFDGQSLELLREWAVPAEPRFLALQPNERTLFVGSAYRGALASIDLKDNSVTDVELPAVVNQSFETGDQFDTTARVTGDITISPDGRVLAIPVLYVDNVTTVPDPNLDGADVDDFFIEDAGDGYSAGGGARFNPSVVIVPIKADGTLVVEDGRRLTLSGQGDDFATLRGYAGSVTFSPDGDTLLATLEGSDAVVRLTIPSNPQRNSGGGAATGVGREPMPMEDFGGDMIDGGFAGSFAVTEFESAPTATVLTDAAPRGVAFVADGEAWVHAGFARTVADLDLAQLPEIESAGGPRGGAPMVDVAMEDEASMEAPRAAASTEFAPASLDPIVAKGRRLFYAANDSQMAAAGAGVSCATCHLGARTDGLTWQFTDGPRQTPSLAGVVSMTAPVTWTLSVETVVEEVVITSQGRMGGDGLPHADAETVAAFVDWTREADVPGAHDLSDSALRGKAIFAREDVGCADCHSGAALTDNEPYEMYGLEQVRTRSLVGIAASAPYFHDGSAPTLRAVVERARDGSMGDTSMLSDDEKADLVAFLSTL